MKHAWLSMLVSFLALSTATGCGDDSAGGSSDGGVSDGQVLPDGAQPPSTTTYNAAAGIGDLLSYTLDLQSLTYSYRILESSYGLAGETGSGTLSHESDGTYVTSEDSAQLIVLPNGLLVGGADLETGGQITSVAFAGVPALTTSYTASEIAGVFNYVNYLCDEPLQAGICTAGYRAYMGTFRVNAGGTVDVCDEGDIESSGAHPCTDGVIQGSWSDRGNGLLDFSMGGMTVATAMLLPSAGGGKVLIVDLKDVPIIGQGPGLLVGVKRQAVTGTDISGVYNYVDTDLEHGVATFPDPAAANDPDSFQIVHTDVDNITETVTGTFTRDAPWSGWLQSDDGVVALVLPGDGVFVFMDSTDNTYVGFGGNI